MANDNKEALGALYLLADALGVNLQENRVSIATPQHIAIARTYNGSLETKLYGTGIVEVQSQNVGVLIEEVARLSDPFAPPGAIFRIRLAVEPCNEDVWCVYAGPGGIILSNDSINRIKYKSVL